jgi:hypothetical protein
VLHCTPQRTCRLRRVFKLFDRLRFSWSDAGALVLEALQAIGTPEAVAFVRGRGRDEPGA